MLQILLKFKKPLVFLLVFTFMLGSLSFERMLANTRQAANSSSFTLFPDWNFETVWETNNAQEAPNAPWFAWKAVGSSVPDNTRTVTGLVSPVVFDDLGFGQAFLDAHAFTVELRTDFVTPAEPKLTATISSDSITGRFTFDNVPFGDYILYITRPGYLTRTMRIVITENDHEIIQLNPPGSAVFDIWKGDTNGNGFIDVDDILAMSTHFGAQWGEPLYEARFDLNGDGVINLDDFDIIINNFGAYWGNYPGAFLPFRAFSDTLAYDIEALIALIRSLGADVFYYTPEELIMMLGGEVHFAIEQGAALQNANPDVLLPDIEDDEDENADTDENNETDESTDEDETLPGADTDETLPGTEDTNNEEE